MMTNNILSRVFFLLLFSGLGYSMVSCDENVLQDFNRLELSIESELPDTAFFKSILPLKLVATNAEEIYVMLVATNAPDAPVYKDTLPNENEGYVFNTEIAVPEVGDWEEGMYTLTVTARAGGETSAETRSLYIMEGEVIKEYYLVGGSSAAGWDPANGIAFAYHSSIDDDGNITAEWYDLFTYLTVEGDGFKLLPTTAGWDGEVSDEGANFTVEEDGFYRIRITPETEEEALQVETVKSNWGLIGEATPGGWDEDTDMAFEGGKGDYTWKLTLPLLAGEYKFRENDDWALNLGGAPDNLVYDGSNLRVDAPGNYKIKLTLDPVEGYSATIE